MKRHRNRWAEMPLQDDRPAACDSRVNLDVSVAVEQAVAGLRPAQREALILFEYEGCTLEEIATIAGVDAGTVKSRLHQAGALEEVARGISEWRRCSWNRLRTGN